MLKLPRIRKITIKEPHFKTFIHVNFIIGILYAFYHFIRTPKAVDMATRRMWAYETWIVFTLYSLFIYLFSLEVASEDGEPVLHKLFRIKKYIETDAKPTDLSEYFRSIEKNPQKYSFDTHQGVYPIEGNLSEKGAIFETREKFLFFPIRLKFETLKTGDNFFAFRLIEPFKLLNIKGRFYIRETEEGSTNIYLAVYSKTAGMMEHIFLGLIFVSPIRILIRKQLKRELDFIKNEVEKINVN
jgi:hypothetical protein